MDSNSKVTMTEVMTLLLPTRPPGHRPKGQKPGLGPCTASASWMSPVTTQGLSFPIQKEVTIFTLFPIP